MPHIYIDGQKIETQNGKTIIEAAYENGLQIPHFCWHPELSVSGNCRMCLVEVGMPKKLPDGNFEKDSEGNINVNYFPKLQIACATPISDGMHVRINNPKVNHAQEAVMEFLLINHPLDCPICDEAGQCKLQEYAFSHSQGESRFEETKNHKDKRQVWGPNVIYDAERCISCSRCIRFGKEIAKQDVLSFVQRGDHVTIRVADGAKFDNDYSMNVIDICPVGALTSSDFRFKSRVWDMSFNDSICTGCARGCNTKLGVRNNEILRVEPDTNLNVNKYWMCDAGRLDYYPEVNTNRIMNPMIIKDNQLTEVAWDEAYSFASQELKKFKPSEIMFIASAKSTLENNFILKKFAKNVIKSSNIDFVKRNNPDFEDDFLKVADRNANTNGLIELGLSPQDDSLTLDTLVDKIKSKAIKALYVMEENLEEFPSLLSNLDKLELLIVHSSNHNNLTKQAHVVFASSTFAEIEGTYVNIMKRVQRVSPALVTKENRSRMGMKLSRLDKFGSHNDRWTQHDDKNCRSSWRIISDLAKSFNADFKHKNASEVFNEIANEIKSLSGMNYDLLKKHKGVQLGKASNPDPIKHEYESHVMKPN